VQALQLLHGGRNPTLRHANTLEALMRLEAAGHISTRTRVALADAYLLLRKVEHRVQIVEDRQTHTLPADPDARASFARSLGYETPEAMITVIERHMRRVHTIFSGLLGAAKEEEPIPPEVELAADAEAPEDQRVAALAKLGARDSHAALQNLARAGLHPRSPFHPHADAAKTKVALHLLAECALSPSFDRALRHLPDLMHSLIIHASYVEGLERPSLRRGVARVLGASDLLARILVSSPMLLPRVLLAETMPARDALERDLDTRLAEASKDNVEQALAVLRHVKQEDTLRTAMADLADTITTTEVYERMTNLAEVIVTRALSLAEAEMVARYGEPLNADGTRAQLAIVAGGKLGAQEMGYRSDLDLSAIYEGSGDTVGAERAPITCGEFFTRVMQRLLSFLTMRMREGDLYPVDMRLRPSGSQGALVVSFENFRTYHQKSAALWERQALVRARTVAGDAGLRARVEEAIAHAAYEVGPVADAARKIHEMRVRMSKERSPIEMRRKDLELFDLKLGDGGLVEAEFLVQYLLIQHGDIHPEIRTTSTRRALEALRDAGLLRPARARRVIQAYDRLRTLQSWLRIAHDEMIDHVDLSPDALRPLALAVGYQGESAQTQLRRDLLSDTAAIHLCYTEVLGTDRG
jgi:[glutamine synthetase] adenylyltransferase / [glutamine synthetase]-adenylyl-L-tyrosine phosphorylase